MTFFQAMFLALPQGYVQYRPNAGSERDSDFPGS